MIAYVKGTLEIIETDAAVVDVHGVGYRFEAPEKPAAEATAQ